MRSGIYKITNLINNKIYIGSTCNFKDRKSKHKNKKTNTMISRAISKYGWDNFLFEIIEYCEKEILIEKITLTRLKTDHRLLNKFNINS